MPKVAGVLFDLGNTLIYFDGAWPDVMQAADAELLSYLQQEGFHLDPQSFVNEFRKRLNAYYQQRESEFIEYTTALVLRTLLTELGNGPVDDARLRPALRRLYAVSQAHWRREDDTLPTLETLKAGGYKLGIISNASDDDDVQTLVDKAGIRPYFEFVLSSAACGIRKPNPAIFGLALERLGLPAARVAMVGDTLGADILGARNAGLYSIWLTRRAKANPNDPATDPASDLAVLRTQHLDTIVPDAQIARLAELPTLLAKK